LTQIKQAYIKTDIKNTVYQHYLSNLCTSAYINFFSTFFAMDYVCFLNINVSPHFMKAYGGFDL